MTTANNQSTSHPTIRNSKTNTAYVFEPIEGGKYITVHLRTGSMSTPMFTMNKEYARIFWETQVNLGFQRVV